MALPGSLIPHSNKRPRSQTPPVARPAPGSATERLANLRALEDRDSQVRNAVLNDQHVEEAPVIPHIPEGSNSDDDIPNNFIYNDLQMTADMNDVDRVDNGTVIHPPGVRSAYFKGVTYRERTLNEEAHWKAAIPDIFKAFMICSFKTKQWRNEEMWNRDLNPQCNCPSWKRSVVEVDAVDLTSRKKITLETCKCVSDLVRLVRKGYIGGTPVRPQTAFSIRLLAFHHAIWKYCTVQLAPFVEAVDEFLDAGNPIFLIKGTEQSCNCRKIFSAAVDAYREMLRLEDETASKALLLSPMDNLATNCPPCFGPKVPGKRANEPDFIVCLDGNFQHRRHEGASASWRGESGVLPLLFISPELINTWKIKMEPPPRRLGAKKKEADEVIVSDSF
ncbi:uncharacterized protein MELLADRAFT_86739 [Melampsora larici-populina 98AG31]|uniref:CxC1-like cysteine cluster associated with KDZ transposases domain-containing protein n=1 Tax=Melampsora larici-populina (strain 98AG31 / pathotype 3-4-7) TaxID=747676 RepID=F4R379_MELLP|nr:uncharacterized protein MELLADRAFT_86739 [Melampsora larici-populina 98AG31]EGG12580.1 hypothetical protein MELLADRAFT_86739 [Melampsora larici-populina 98AG31]